MHQPVRFLKHLNLHLFVVLASTHLPRLALGNNINSRHINPVETWRQTYVSVYCLCTFRLYMQSDPNNVRITNIKWHNKHGNLLAPSNPKYTTNADNTCPPWESPWECETYNQRRQSVPWECVAAIVMKLCPANFRSGCHWKTNPTQPKSSYTTMGHLYGGSGVPLP